MRRTCCPASPERRQEVWAQVAVGEKTNEIPEARKVLPTLPIAGRVCTFDALHSHRQLWNLLRLHHAYPLFVIKGNEPTLQADVTTYFADPHAQVHQAETMDRHLGALRAGASKSVRNCVPIFRRSGQESPMSPN